MALVITPHRFNPWSVLSDYESLRNKNRKDVFDIGATCTFIGTMRDFNQNKTISSMTLEHYPEMVNRVLADLVTETRNRWCLQDLFLLHRVGDIYPGEPIVLIAAWSSHRKESFEACRHVMEELKSNAPFWKKESLALGEKRWVANNTPGYNHGY